MELEALAIVLAALAPVVYFILDRAKVQLPERAHRWLPETAAVLGIASSGLALYFTGPHDAVTWILYMTSGMWSALGAVGIHQSKRTKEV